MNSQHYQLATMINCLKETLIKSIIISILVVLTNSTQYCSSNCQGDTLCTVSQPTLCTTCNLPYVTNTTNCVLTSQITAFAYELQMDVNFTFSGFSSNALLTNILCGSVTGGGYMVGPLVKNNYIAKIYTGLGISHYLITLFYGYGLMGPWSNNSITTTVTDGNGLQTVNPIQGQDCGGTTIAMTPCFAGIGCFKNNKFPVSHNTDTLIVNFSAVGSSISTSAAIQFWGLKDLIVVVHSCHSTCLTCTNPAFTDCLSCITGLYLQGSVCIISCPIYTIPTLNQCVLSCPIYFFLNTANSYCQPCPNGCPVCISSDSCGSWQSDADPANLFYDKIQLWIILIIVGLIVLAILIWKFCFSKKSFYNSMQEEVIDHKPVQQKKNGLPNQSSEQMQHWIEDIDDLHMTRATPQRKITSDSIQGIGGSINKGR